MQSEIDDGKNKDVVLHDQGNNNKLDEPAETQLNEEIPNQPEKNPHEPPNYQPIEGKPDGPANSHPTEGKPVDPPISLPNEGNADEFGSQSKENLDSDKRLQDHDKHDPAEGALQSKEKPDGKQKKRKLMLKKKRLNASNGNAAQKNLNIVKPMMAHQKKEKFTKPEVSLQEKNLEIVNMVNQQPKGETDVPEGTDQIRANDKNIGDMSKDDMNKKRKQRAKRGKVSTGFKIEKLKQKIGEASGNLNTKKMAGKFSVQDKGTMHDKTTEKLGGLIFMCSSKTKPDCFSYSVMGVSVNKKDLVLRIKPGLKLFLYDFDLKHMYGVYRATSSGGMKLEPAAFGGAFPAQVKFEVFKDCYPLPESVFGKAIKENYNEKRKFKTELTFEQVKKLTTLFRTVGVSSKPDTRSLPVRGDEEAKIHSGDREYRTHSSRGRSNRDDYTSVDYGREARKEEFSRDSFISEREYRTYGLLGRRRSRSPPRLASLVPRHDHERDVHLRYPPVYGDATTSIRHDPLVMGRSVSRLYSFENQRELSSSIHPQPTVFEGRRYLTHEPINQLDYQSHLPSAVRRQTSGCDFPDDPYSSSIRRNELGAGPYYSLDGRRMVFLPETNSSRRREPEVNVFDHNLGYAYQEASRPDSLSVPVSSRYSFAGPSSYH